MSRRRPTWCSSNPRCRRPRVDALAQMGYRLKEVPSLGAVGAITIAPGDLNGAFDPRKGGGAAGL